MAVTWLFTQPLFPTVSAGIYSGPSGARCIVELDLVNNVDLKEYRILSYSVHGTLGLITLDDDIFLCVVSGTSRAATVQPGHTIQKILSVDFRESTRSSASQVESWRLTSVRLP